MPDYTDTLLKMADAVAYMAFHPSWIVIVSPIIAVLISALLGYMASQRTIGKQHKRETTREQKKKELVLDLLGREIKLRWEGDIAPYIRELFQLSQLKGLRRFARMTLRADDLFVLREISTSFPDYYFLENPDLVSEIIHGHLLYADLIDFQTSVKQFLGDWKLIFTRRYRETEDDLWKRFHEKLDELDIRLKSILSRLS